MSAIVAFYRGQSPDYLGRTLEEIWSWNHSKLEAKHDYIQVLFPNRQPSSVTPMAPVLDEETIRQFREDQALQVNLERSFEKMLDFYGLQFNLEKDKIICGENYDSRIENWMNPYNHNFLRITRILNCLTALGLEDKAKAFFEALQDIYRGHSDIIGERTMEFWREAVN